MRLSFQSVVFVLVTGSVWAQFKPAVDITCLEKQGVSWKQISDDQTEHFNHMAWSTQNWLMCYLHWRPLTQTNEHINPQYARDRLLNFWGFDMGMFELSDLEGAERINGHDAYYVSGTFRKMVQTRFVIWNCPESKRQFIADLNYNTKVGTPEFLFDLQLLITKTVCCHGACPRPWPEILPQRVDFGELDVSFSIPASWRSNIFPYKKWYPEGPTKDSGSIWTLMTESNLRMDILWTSAESDLNAERFKDFFEVLSQTVPEPSEEQPHITEFSQLEFQSQKLGLTCSGRYEARYPKESDDFIFEAFLTTQQGQTVCVIVSCIDYQDIWSRPVDLCPNLVRFRARIMDDILPCTGLFDL